MATKKSLVAAVAVLTLFGGYVALAQMPTPDPKMNFFVTSVPIGDGGNLGGLAGADAHCQSLAAAVGAGKHTWHAYLSTAAAANAPTIANAGNNSGFIAAKPK
jgi:hypothetical protein